MDASALDAQIRMLEYKPSKEVLSVFPEEEDFFADTQLQFYKARAVLFTEQGGRWYVLLRHLRHTRAYISFLKFVLGVPIPVMGKLVMRGVAPVDFVLFSLGTGMTLDELSLLASGNFSQIMSGYVEGTFDGERDPLNRVMAASRVGLGYWRSVRKVVHSRARRLVMQRQASVLSSHPKVWSKSSCWALPRAIRKVYESAEGEEEVRLEYDDVLARAHSSPAAAAVQQGEGGSSVGQSMVLTQSALDPDLRGMSAESQRGLAAAIESLREDTGFRGQIRVIDNEFGDALPSLMQGSSETMVYLVQASAENLPEHALDGRMLPYSKSGGKIESDAAVSADGVMWVPLDESVEWLERRRETGIEDAEAVLLGGSLLRSLDPHALVAPLPAVPELLGFTAVGIQALAEELGSATGSGKYLYGSCFRYTLTGMGTTPRAHLSRSDLVSDGTESVMSGGDGLTRRFMVVVSWSPRKSTSKLVLERVSDGRLFGCGSSLVGRELVRLTGAGVSPHTPLKLMAMAMMRLAAEYRFLTWRGNRAKTVGKPMIPPNTHPWVCGVGGVDADAPRLLAKVINPWIKREVASALRARVQRRRGHDGGGGGGGGEGDAGWEIKQARKARQARRVRAEERRKKLKLRKKRVEWSKYWRRSGVEPRAHVLDVDEVSLSEYDDSDGDGGDDESGWESSYFSYSSLE